VGEDYTGEVLLSIEGSVVVEEGTDDQLLPALAFTVYDPAEGAVSLDGVGFEVVDGITEGEYPSKFRFQVTAPPPQNVMWPSSLMDPSLSGSYASGFLVMLPPDHPQTFSSHSGMRALVGCDDEECLTVRREDETCDRAGLCRTQTLRCATQECELVLALGDPAIVEQSVGGTSASRQIGDDYVTYRSHCNAEFECYREVYRCDGRGLPSSLIDMDWKGSIEHCEVLEETRDPGFVDFWEVSTAEDYWVIFASDDHPEHPIAPLRRGYNLVEWVDDSTVEQWIDWKVCQDDAVNAAVQEFNREQGTDYASLWGIESEPDQEAIFLRGTDLAADCPNAPHYESRNDTGSTLTIELGPPPKGALG
jgi:hypothetical protein